MRVEKIVKDVSEKEFYEFINSYPRKLEKHYHGMYSPARISYNDLELSDKWPECMVASTEDYDNPPSLYEEDRYFRITINYKEVFDNK